jgi:hypothetical protein
MSNRKSIRIWLLILLISIVLVSCATNRLNVAEADELLYGTWDDEENRAFREITSDGKMLTFRTAEKPKREDRFSIEESWTDDSGNTYYKIITMRSRYPYDESRASKWFWLIKVNAARDTLEWVRSPTAFPTEVSRSGGKYSICYRK